MVFFSYPGKAIEEEDKRMLGGGSFQSLETGKALRRSRHLALPWLGKRNGIRYASGRTISCLVGDQKDFRKDLFVVFIALSRAVG